MKKILTLLILFFMTILIGCGVKHQHAYKVLNYDETSHWLECECHEKETSEKHIFKDGVITLDATDKKEGIKSFECETCDYVKEESISKIKGIEVESYPQLTNSDIVYYEGSIYTYGGNGNGRTDSIYRYSVNDNKLYMLDVKMAMPSTSHRVVLVGSKVYLFGGTGATRPTEIYIHDLEAQTFEPLGVHLPYGMNCFQVGYYGNKIYFIGGYNGAMLSDILAFDLDTYKITKLDAKLPTTVFKGAWCTVGKYTYVIGGTNGNRLTSIYRFDAETHEVKEMNAKLPEKVSQSRAVYDGEGNIYIYGGTIDDTSNHVYGLVDYIVKYNIESDVAEFTSYKLPQVLANVSAVRTEEGIYILGGDNDFIDVIIKHVGDTVSAVRTSIDIR